MLKYIFSLTLLLILVSCKSTSAIKQDIQLNGKYDNGVTWIYKGEVKNNKPHGHGVLTTSIGGRHEGRWESFYLMEGTRFFDKNNFEKGSFFNGKTTLTNSLTGLVIERTYKNGKLISQKSSLMSAVNSANYEKAYKLRGKNPFLGVSFKFDEKTSSINVMGIELNSPAYLAGIQAEDRILKYGKVTPNSQNAFLEAIQNTTYGESVNIRLSRGGKSFNVIAYPSIRPDNYKPTKGMFNSNSYEELIAFHLKYLITFDRNISKLDMPVKYSRLAKSKKNEIIVGFKDSQLCVLKEKEWIYKGTSCKTGVAHGKGIAINYLNGLRFDGQFSLGKRVNGIISINGIEMYDGKFKDGRPNGKGICFYKGKEPETCEYYRGKRVDAIYKQRLSNIEQQRKMDEKLAKMERMQQQQNARISQMQGQINNSAQQNRGTSVGQQIGNYAMQKAGEKVMDKLFDRLF